MVEFAVFLMQEYYEDYSKEKKGVFAAVHFALFYTALLNAFQSIILASVVGRVSQRMWVQTEALELNHYVEIREEFDRVSSQLTALQGKMQKSSTSGSTLGSDKPEDEGRPTTEDAFEWNSTGLRGLWQTTVDRIRYPQLKSRYNELIVQVRFHELRVHFLRAYHLPLKLKISDYLVRSQQHVLIKLVHVSSTAWLLLTASINLLYFVLGIVGTKTGDPGLVGSSLIFIFFSCMAIIVMVALEVRNKVKVIFKEIMHRPELWAVQDDEEEKERLANEQMKLFWGSSPKLIIAAIQFMQFGYAVALAAIIMFWEEIGDGGLGMHWFWLAIIGCYSLFVYVAAQVIPRYTLCTSLGQLVDKKRLSECVASFHLEEAKRQRHEEIWLRNQLDDGPQAAPPMLFQEEPEILSRLSGSGGLPSTSASTDLSERSAVSSNALSIADLVSLDTNSLRTNLPDSERAVLSNRLASRRDRRSRKKSVSDGVALMAKLHNTLADTLVDGCSEASGGQANAPSKAVRAQDDSAVDTEKKGNEADKPAAAPQEPLQAEDTMRNSLIARRRTRRGRMKSVSDGVALMAALEASEVETPQLQPQPRLSMVRENSERIADLVFVDTDSLRASLRSTDADLFFSAGPRTSPRANRKKSNSDGVAEMSASTGLESQLGARRFRRRKTKSDGVGAMAKGFRESSVSVDLKAFTVSNAEAKADTPDTTPLPPKDDNDGISLDVLKMEEEMETRLDMEKVIADKNLDDLSNRSLASDDNHSDFDDVPMANPAMMKMMTVEVEKHIDRVENWREYFLSKRYPVISNVFGTMIAFFVVGSRIERFLHTENIVSEEWISFDFGESLTFWFFSAWLFFFLSMDASVFYVLGPYHAQHALRARKVWVATVLDVIICSTCLVTFYTAERRRCCHPSEEDTVRRVLEEVYDKLLLPAPCACQAFGSRLYGGLGTIEPYISLVGLRLIRFWFASRIVRLLDMKRGAQITRDEAQALAADNENLDPFDMVDDEHSPDHGDDHGHHHGEEKGTIADLWEAAVGKHPEIVAKYGQFSGELLQVMLGIPIIESTPAPVVFDTGVTAMFPSNDTTPQASKPSYIIEDQYSSLPAETQEIIMAGKLGKDVVCVSNPSSRAATFTIPEGVDGHAVVSEQDNQTRRFEVAADPITPSLDVAESVFDAPNARLVRSMRRCERKLLPILDHWTVVDVVITRFEIVYFDAVGADDNFDNPRIFEALSATKGGKGLRLCDVAAGRRIVGHLSLSEVNWINVERIMPSDEAREDTDASDDEILKKTEFWQTKADTVRFNRREFWHKVKQDLLTVHTLAGHTLQLRYYSDLEDAEHHPERQAEENEADGPIYKNNSFQWVQTIGRLCGPEQLKQSLVHFGDESPDELRDYLIVHSEETEKGHRRGHSRLASIGGSLHNRHGSMGNLRGLDIAAAMGSIQPNRPGPARRASSFGDSLVHSFSTSRRASAYNRSASTGTDVDTEAHGSSRKPSFRRSASHGTDGDANDANDMV
jgi:hypothetical protein